MNTFYQIKAIRKNTKPPMWRRAFIPANITFTQLAVVLEELLEINKTEMFEFEFYQRGLRLIEWNERNMQPNYSFGYADASEHYINDIFDEEDWFTFRILNKKMNMPVYRIEIEQECEGVSYKGKELTHPFMIKWKVNPNDKYWSDGSGLNAIFEEKYQIYSAANSYSSFAKCLNKIEKKGLNISEKAESREKNSRQSTKDILGELAKTIDKYIKNKS